MMILGFGAMLCKLIAESGAADKITHELVTKFVLKHFQFSLIIIGFIIGIPSILTTKYLLSGIMNRLVPKLKREFIILDSNSHFITPCLRLSLIIPLLPVIIIAGSSFYLLIFNENLIIKSLSNPSIAMLCSVLAGIYFLGIRLRRSMCDIMIILREAISSITMILFIIAGAGAFKQIIITTEINLQLGTYFQSLGFSPLILVWLIAAIIRIIIGSATVAGLTAAGIMMPMVESSGIAPVLLVLATGAGSIFFSHINDGGFWLFKEYFNISI